MPTYRYAPHKVSAKKTVKCEGCGKRMTRSTTFEQTENPFNRNKETGLPKTLPEIYAELKQEKQEWESDKSGYYCWPCEEKRGAA